MNRFLPGVLFFLSGSIVLGAWAARFELATAIQFENKTADSGLHFVLENHPTPRKHLIETMAGGMAAFDFNGDGRVDLFFPNGADLPSLRKTNAGSHNRLFRNEGNLRFTDVTDEAGLSGAGYAIGAAAADFDNDGRPDLFVAGWKENRLYHNVDGRRFEDVTSRSGIQFEGWAVAAAWFDYDRDGLLDLFIVQYVNTTPDGEPACHDPSGRYPVYCNPTLFQGASNRLYRNLGGGRFADVSGETGISKAVGKGMSAAIADYDRDGWPDVFVTNDTLPNFLFHNLHGKRFEEVALEQGVALPNDGKAVSGMGTDFRDMDNDGWPDVVFTALAGQTFPLFRNRKSSGFEENTAATQLGPLTKNVSGWGVALADFDNDGWKDLFSANSHVTDNIELFSGDRYRLANSLFRNTGEGRFQDESQSPELIREVKAHRGLVVPDLDGDGRLDAVVSVLGEAPELWHNISPGRNHWIEFKLVGSTSNRDSIGAVIHLGHQWNGMTSSVGYASSNLSPVHFGLGSQTLIPSVEIHWPSGTVQQLKDQKADQVLVVIEPCCQNSLQQSERGRK